MFIKAQKQLIYNARKPFFWKKDSKKDTESETMKKFKEINKEFKIAKEFQRFNINTEKVKPYLSDAEKQKLEKSLKKVVDEYLETYKFDDKFKEQKFVGLLSQVSYAYDNSIILKDSRFADLIEKIASDVRDFKDFRSIALFLSFCSHNDVNRPLIWENFNAVIRNLYQKISFEERFTVLMSCNSKNESGI